MMFLRLRMMPATPRVNRIGGDDEIMVETDDHGCSLHARPRRDFLEFDRRGAGARVLLRDILALDIRPVAQRQDDGADHRGQQDEARRLEQIDILRVEHLRRAPPCW